MATTITIAPGTRIDRAAEEMIATAKKINASVSATFNGIELTAAPTSTDRDIVAAYDTLCQLRERKARCLREAAPDLLAAAEKAIAALSSDEEVERSEGRVGPATEASNALLAAIAKARGQS